MSNNLLKILKGGGSNLDLMKAGKAPIGPDGLQMQLHHLFGQEPGSIAELTKTDFAKGSKALKKLIEESFNNDRIKAGYWDDFADKDWKEREKDFVAEGLSKPDFFTGKLRWKKQELHLKGTAPSNKSFLNSKADAQAVLDEVMQGQGSILKIIGSENRFYFRSNKITGTYVNELYGVQEATNLFMIKGKGQSSVVPANPWTEF